MTVRQRPAFFVALVVMFVLGLIPIALVWLVLVAGVLGAIAAVFDLVWQARR